MNATGVTRPSHCAAALLRTALLAVLLIALTLPACREDDEVLGLSGSRVPDTTPGQTDVPPTDAPSTDVPTEVPPTEVPPTEVPPTEVPPTEVPPTEVPPTEVPPTEVPPTEVPPTEVPPPPLALTSLDPNCGPGDGNASVTVRGANFDDTLEVIFDGIAAPVVDVQTPGRAVVQTPAISIDLPRFIDVEAWSPDDRSATLPESWYVFRGFSHLPFGEPTADEFRQIAIGDIDGSGRAALVIATDNGVLIRRRIAPDGTFESELLHDTCENAFSVTIADVNGDGIGDILAGCGQTLQVLFGRPDDMPEAGPATDMSPAGFGGVITAIHADDLTGNGAMDLVIHPQSGGFFPVYTGLGNGNFAPAGTVLTGTGANVSALGDVFGNGTPDLVVGYFDEDVVRLFEGQSGPSWRSPVETPLNDIQTIAIAPPAPGATPWVGIGANDASVGASVFTVTDEGTLEPLFQAVGGGLSDILLADFDADGHLDVAVGSGPGVGVWLSDSDGTLCEVRLDAPVAPTQLVAGDLTGDGTPDVAGIHSATGDLWLMLSQP